MSAPRFHALSGVPLEWAEFGKQQDEQLATGIPDLDRLLQGGLPRGKLVEITGRNSSGRTSLICSVLSRAAAAGECTAYVDAFDTFDPEFAGKAGVDPEAVLWVRCRGVGLEPEAAADRALKAADILVQAGGFGVIVLDLESVSCRSASRILRIPAHSWFRLQRAVKGSPTVLLVLTGHKLTSGAAVVLSLERRQVHWGSPRPAYHFEERTPAPGGRLGTRFQGVESQARLLRGEFHGGVAVHCRF